MFLASNVRLDTLCPPKKKYKKQTCCREVTREGSADTHSPASTHRRKDKAALKSSLRLLSELKDDGPSFVSWRESILDFHWPSSPHLSHSSTEHWMKPGGRKCQYLLKDYVAEVITSPTSLQLKPLQSLSCHYSDDLGNVIFKNQHFLLLLTFCNLLFWFSLYVNAQGHYGSYLVFFIDIIQHINKLCMYELFCVE